MKYVAAAVAALALGGCASGGDNGAATASTATLGQPAPAFSEKGIDGSTLTLAQFKGKAVYLNFFATWCPPCNEEAPDVEKLQQKYKSQGLQVVGVDGLENQSKAQSFVKAHGLTYPAVVDDGTLRDQYKINGLPVHVFIDKSGTIKKIETGELTKAEIESDIKSIL